MENDTKKPRITFKTALWYFLRAFLVMYVAVFALQRYLLYPTYIPNHMVGTLGSPADYHLTGFTAVHFTDADGTHVLGWYHAPSSDMPIILYFHGNGSTLNMRAERYQHFAESGYGVFALSFRGYAGSEGSPSEDGLYEDARAALAWIHQQYKTPRIILYGESLGTGVAVEMAKEQTVFGVVLQSAYTSIARIASETYWFLPGSYYLVLDRFDSLSKIADIRCPVLIIHGDQDSIVPIAHGRALAAAARSRKQFITVHGAGHMNIPDATIISAMNDFFINPRPQ